MGEFPATHWTLIDAARSGDASALRDFALSYRPPILAYLRSRCPTQAEDLAQEVFLQLFHAGALDRADPARGYFRQLVRAVSRNVLGNHLRHEQTLKRGGGLEFVPLDGTELSSSADDAFDREWLASLLQGALGRLAQNNPNYYEAVRQFLLEGNCQAEIAKSLGCKEKDVKNRVHRGRKKLIAYLEEEIAKYSLSHEEYAEELRFLSGFFPALAAGKELRQSGCAEAQGDPLL